ncbi:PREDICTED: aprataxin and PNK-like factor [Nanorana parkeri]|uniref:aprataxin and PNK-like factor n=1 Tax=Nanorana parkeri TaxID=125878 RepID=UPI0008548975|nr:PREDICTED: aprataxin and PNK-like factor [Nanorana parkeri]
MGKKRRNVTDRTGKTVESVTENKQPRTVKSRNNGDEGPLKKNKAEVPTEDLPGTSSGTVRARVEHKSTLELIENEEEEMAVVGHDHSPGPSPKMESSGSPSGSASTKKCQTSDSQTVNNVISQSATSPQTTQQASKRRTPCMFADSCYRKNPVHFQEFSHPGDSDYLDVESGSQDDNDDRPECPYGTDCYRKNPQHKLEYKHTRPPGRRLRKRAAKKAKNALDDDSDNDGEPNEYDLEDSFIDDEEEEDFTDEDSDWMPDSEEKDSEDVNQLVKEAKRFVKAKH